MFEVYKRYPFPVPARVKFLNLFRIPFMIRPLESFLVSQLSNHSAWWKKFIPPLYFFKEGSYRSAEREGLRYKLDLSKMIDHAIYFYSDKDVTWKNLFRILKPDFHIIDAGANIGYLSLQFARRCDKGFVYCFEPETENFHCLSENVRLNGLEKQMKLFKYALGEKPGMATLYKPYRNNPGANRILDRAPEMEAPAEKVEIVPLDTLHDQGVFKKVEVMKIDVEGFELFVLKGARKLIDRWRPILFVELAEVNLNQQNQTAASLINFIQDLGYRIWDARTLGPVDLSQKIHTDIICLPDNRDLKSILQP